MVDPFDIAGLIHGALAAVCPIDGVQIGDPTNSATWTFWPDASATPAQIAAATALLATFSPTNLPVATTISASAFQARFTPAEQAAIWAAAAKDTTGALGAGLTMGLTAASIDLTDPVVAGWMAGLVAVGAITAARQAAILTP